MPSLWNRENAVVADYRCYFFGHPTASTFSALSSIEAPENLSAETDDDAGMMAESIYRQRRNQIHGYELWQGTRLLHRRLGSFHDREAAKRDFREPRPKAEG